MQKSGGVCHGSDSYLCKLISPTNLPTDYLVIVGILGVFAAVSTLKSIHHQAVQMRKQTKILRESADAAKDTADVAKKNIEVLVSKERAQLAVNFKPLNLQQKAVPGRDARLIEFTVSIYGSTAATILDSGVTSGIWIKGQESDPDLGSAIMFPMTGLPTLILPNAPSLEPEAFLFFEENEAMILEAIQKGDMVVAVRGFVRYQDIFDAVRTLRFRYYWGPWWRGKKALGLKGFWPDVSSGQWTKCGPPQDNQDNPD
ncbi:MAG: hypothetical protein WBE86_06340 [Candidatus Acidiferrales bacterium]